MEIMPQDRKIKVIRNIMKRYFIVTFITILILLMFTIPLSASNDSLSLPECIQKAIQNNPSLISVGKDVGIGKQGVQTAQSEKLPKLSLIASYNLREYVWVNL